MSNVPMTLPELIISTQAFPYSHTSSYLELDDGRIFHSTCGICTISEDGGLTWSKQKWLKDAGGEVVFSTSCVKLNAKNGIGLVGELRMDKSEGNFSLRKKMPRYPVFYRSQDNGQTWGPPIPMAPAHPLLDTLALQDVAIRTSSGRIVVPMYVAMGKRGTGPHDCQLPLAGKLVHNQFIHTTGHFYDPGFDTCFVCYSDDDGRTWTQNADGMIFIQLDWNSDYNYACEPTIAEVAPGRLLMFMRTGLGRLFQCWSDDDGETWSRPMTTSLPACTTPAQLRKLPTGHLLCIWNQQSQDEIRRGLNRTRLSSAISRDGGRVWEFFQNIESIHETTRVPPGPIQPVRPNQIHFPAGQPAVEWPEEDVQDLDQLSRFSYPMVGVFKDRVIVSYKYAGMMEEDPVKAELRYPGTGVFNEEAGQICGQRLKILPIEWFYSGKEPADNPALKAAYEPVAKPGM